MMKTYHVQITKYAQRQIKDIARYVKIKLKNPDAAKKLINDLKTAMLSLENMPQRILLTEDEPWRSEGIHKMPVKKYLVYFWIDEIKDIVYITAVIYGQREQKRQLSKMKIE